MLISSDLCKTVKWSITGIGWFAETNNFGFSIIKNMKLTLYGIECGNNRKEPTDPMSSWMEARGKKNHTFIVKLKITKYK